MKNIYSFIIVFIILAAGIGFYFYYSNNQKNSSNSGNAQYNSTKVSSSNELNTNDLNASDSNNGNTSEQNSKDASPKQEVETELSSFSTKIYTKDKERQNNINITCSSLNNTFVENGETFSFCSIVGKATTSKGYEKADVFKDGEVVQALGGGNCQVSTTLYNAVLKVDGLNVTERHKHSNSVPYISKGKDAAVSYGTYDFKFVNNIGNKIKISASCDKDYVYIKLFKIE